MAGRYSSHVCDNDVGTEGDGNAVNMSGHWPGLEEFVPDLSGWMNSGACGLGSVCMFV